MDYARELGGSEADFGRRPFVGGAPFDAEHARDGLTPIERTAIVSASASATVADPAELLSGRWRWVERFERGDERFFVARADDRGRPLGGRARAVLEGAAAGRSNKEIAYELGVAPSTVSSHLVKAMRRLGITDVATLVELRSGAGDVRRVKVSSALHLVVRRSLLPRRDLAPALTAAERHVARLAAGGLSNLEIAELRGTSARTVANQMAAILRKLAVGSRRELSVRCSRAARCSDPSSCSP